MQTTLGKFDARFEHLDARFEHLDIRFEHLHSGQVAVEKKLDRLTQKVGELCVTSARHDAILDQLHSGQMEIVGKFDSLTKKVGELCITSTKQESRLDQLGESQTEMKAVFSVAASEIGKLMNWRQRLLMAAFVIVGMTSLLGFVLVNGANIVQNSPMFMKAPDQAP
jgi:chaperonin cofactor prefoldin